jgi:hypothetical protein
MMTLDPLHAANIYRKEHGNLMQLLTRKDFASCVKLDGPVVRLAPVYHMQSAVSAGIMPYTLLQQGIEAWRKHDILVRRNLRKIKANVCKQLRKRARQHMFCRRMTKSIS